MQNSKITALHEFGILGYGPEIDYTIRKSRRARRVSLRVDYQGNVQVTVPWRVAAWQAETFLRQKISWVRRVQEKQQQKWGRRSGLPAAVHEVLVQEYRQQAQHYFEDVVPAMAAALGFPSPRISIAHFRSQWGSCNRSQAKVAFTWRLMLLPEWVARYVAAHEVAHLRQANHSRAFWGVVAELYPGYSEARRWLRRHGKISLAP